MISKLKSTLKYQKIHFFFNTPILPLIEYLLSETSSEIIYSSNTDKHTTKFIATIPSKNRKEWHDILNPDSSFQLNCFALQMLKSPTQKRIADEKITIEMRLRS